MKQSTTYVAMDVHKKHHSSRDERIVGGVGGGGESGTAGM